ncbi:MAG: HAD-IA family hydrolase [Planctomycetes bacterium]|nr:HAD-IA family hydrolase [Planctomycetota bacterium]
MVDTLGVIFDVDGVLIDSYQSHFESWRVLADQMGLPFTEAEFVRGFGRTTRETIVDQWPDRAWTADEVRQLEDRKERVYRENIQGQFPAMPGASDLIRSLHAAGYRIAVGSSGPPANVDLVIDQLGVAELIRCRITARHVTRGKPDPQVFQLAAEGLELSAHNCCVVEDAPVGIQAAHAAEIVCVGIASTGRNHFDLKNAEWIVHSLDELTPQRVAELIRAGLRSNSTTNQE